MKPTDFSKYLSDYLCRYLPHERGASGNTVVAYRDTFVLFIRFLESRNLKIHKLTLAKITRQMVVEFLDWLQNDRNCGNASRNARLAAIHSFFRYLQYQRPEYLYDYQDILSIKVKKTHRPAINHLIVEGITLLLQQPVTTSKKGRRDLALLSLMYDTGARVQEIIDLTPATIRLETPCTIRITGKGKKKRIVPMLDKQVDLLKGYLKENRLLNPEANNHPLFFNSRKEKLTRAGVTYILKKYAAQANAIKPEQVPDKLSCHSLRHSKAMHLLQAGVNLVYIRDLLGHTSVQTTEIYAKADSAHKRRVIEAAYQDVTPEQHAVWAENINLLEWLKSL
jgi:integrase/recombinase XerD